MALIPASAFISGPAWYNSMTWHDTRRGHFIMIIDRGVLPALLATVLFAIAEGIVQYLTNVSGILQAYIFRIPVMFLIVILIVMIIQRSIPKLSNLKISAVFWRAVASGLNSLFLTISFGFSSSQSWAYTLFFLHPIFAISYSAAIKKTLPSVDGWSAFGLMAFGIILFLSAAPSQCEDFSNIITPELPKIILWLVTYVCPILAAILFAMTNIITNHIDEVNLRGRDGKEFTSLDLNYYSLLLGAIGCFVIWIALALKGIQLHLPTLNSEQDQYIILDFLICAIVYVCGGLSSTHAFKITKDIALISALDLTIVIVSVPIDLWRRTICWSDLAGQKGIALLAVAGGGFWLILAGRKKGLS